MKTKRKGFNMFQKRRKKKKQSTLLYVDATNKSYERAISEFKRKVKNSNMLKELSKKFYNEEISNSISVLILSND